MTTPWRTKILDNDIPCTRECERRYPGCHDKCPEWQQYLAKRNARLAQKQKDNEAEELYYLLAKKTHKRVAEWKNRLPKHNPHKG